MNAKMQKFPGYFGIHGKQSADADAAAVPARAFGGNVDHAQHGGVMGVKGMGHAGVLPVHGERVLRKVVGANAKKVSLASQLVAEHHGGGGFDHHALLYRAKGDSPVSKLPLAVRDKDLAGPQFLQRGDQRIGNA